MITEEQAYAIAKKIIPEVDSYSDEDLAYVFMNSKAKANELYDNEVVVLKKDGRVISYVDYITMPNKSITINNKQISVR